MSMANEVKIVVTGSNKSKPPLQEALSDVNKIRVAVDKLPNTKEIKVTVTDDTAAAVQRIAAVTAATDDLVDAQKRLSDTQDDVDIGRSFDIAGKLGNFKSQLGAEFKTAGMQAGAAFAGAMGAEVSSIGAAGLFVGIAAAAQAQVPAVREAYGGLWNYIKSEAQATSSVLGDEFVRGAEQLGRTFTALKPQLIEGFANAQPFVDNLFGGIDRGVRASMPGLVAASGKVADSSKGMADMLESAGRGVSNFFTEATAGASTGGDAFRTLGHIIERMGTFAGRVLSDLSSSSSMVFPQVTEAIDSVATAGENLAENVFPALASGAALGLSGFSLLVNLANTLLTALGPLAPQILTAVSALKMLDMITFGGVQGQWDKFKQSISDAPGAAGKAKAGFVGLLTTLGPVALGAAAVGFALDALATNQQRANERQRALNEAFRESKGAIDANVRATVAKNLADDGLLQKGKDLKISASTLVDAWLGQQSAIDTLREATGRYTAELEGQGQMEGQVAQGSDALSTKAHELISALSDQNSEVSKAAREGRLLGEAMQHGASSTDALRQSAQELHDTLLALVDKDLAYRNAIDQTAEAQAAAAEVLKKHKTSSDEYKDASREVEGAMLAQANAAKELGMANSLATTDAGKLEDGTRAMTAEVVRMAQVAGQDAPRALQQLLVGMSMADLSAQGATRSIDGAGNAVIRLPDGKEIRVTAHDAASSLITSIANRNYRAVVYVDAVFRQTPNGALLNSRSAWGNAAGGAVVGHAAEGGARSGLTEVNERGPELGRTQRGDLVDLQGGMTVVPAGQSAAIAAAAAGGQGGGWGGGGPMVIQLVLDKRVVGEVSVDYTRRQIRGQAGGSVSTFFGGRP